ncbi:lipopolysaccharide biosynthesis protein [Bradyrhizobium xenonodulans]|uniref:Lipopolysaccharide biosynthesis protein n=1 Tax=Bradyrhizobium xenonodulans TaxID=2736875 RepID=A0ABY7MS05_9BRAD|nr:lipopolysaccharide biosynthesis protein [Bradyrhizobium xenonodulans]WBL80319.1 lipopolysaccharide biosynthesis protein [Bradyrhizobium xenonodulans]
MDSNSKSRAAKNIAVTGIAQAWRFVTGFLLTVATTRLLKPSDFGILAMVATATALISVVKDLGISQAIIQRSTTSPSQLNSLFWVSVLASVGFALVLGGSAPLLAGFYDEPRVTLVTFAFALLVLISGPQAVPTAILNRDSHFNQLAIVDIVSATITFGIGVVGALLWPSYWVLFASAAGGTIVSAAGIWLSARYRPGLPHFDSSTVHMLRFGWHVSGFNLVNYFSRNSDNILIGHFLGSDQLGLYDRAYRLLLFPIGQLNGPIGQVLVPLMSRIRTDAARYRSTYTEAVSLMMLAAQPGILCAVICAPELLEILFGPQWKPAAPIFQWLGIAGLHQVMSSTTGWLFLSQGRGADLFRLGTYGAVITVASFVIGLRWGVVGVAASYTVANYVALIPLIWIAAGRSGPVSCKDLVNLAFPHVLATLGAAGVLEVIRRTVEAITSLQMLALFAVSYLVYLCFILLFETKRELLRRGLRMLKSKRI